MENECTCPAACKTPRDKHLSEPGCPEQFCKCGKFIGRFWWFERPGNQYPVAMLCEKCRKSG